MARRATSLGPKPSLFCLVFSCFFFFVLFFCFFPLEKGIFRLFLSVSLCFSLAFFGLPLFQCLFLCLSLVLVFLSSFLSFLLLSFVSLFLSLFCCFCLSSLLLFHERNNIKIFNYKPFFINPFSFFLGGRGGSVLFSH